MPGLLKKVTNEMAYLKAGIQGAAGSGKTRTATEIAIGLAKLHGNKPVTVCDSEGGVDFVKPLFDKAEVELYRVKTASFADLCEFMRESQQMGAAVALIDSITAFWKNLLWVYRLSKVKARLRRQGWFTKMAIDEQEKKLEQEAKAYRMTMPDWGPVKDTWQEFADLYLDSQMHCILCGRLGFDWDFEEDENGHKNLVKTGTKMKTEGEMAYEPSLLLEMEIIKPRPDEVRQGKVASKWTHRCTVLKDRTDLMNGATIDNPTFAAFKPVVDWLNIGGEHVSKERPKNGEVFTANGETEASEYLRQRKILIEEIAGELGLAFPSTGKEDKQARAVIAKHLMGTTSQTAAERLPMGKLQAARTALEATIAHYKEHDGELLDLPEQPPVPTDEPMWSSTMGADR